MSCLVNPNLWIDIIVIIAMVAIVRVLVPWLVGFFALPAPIISIINIVLWAVIAIAGVYLLFDLLGCVFGGTGGLRLPTYR